MGISKTTKILCVILCVDTCNLVVLLSASFSWHLISLWIKTCRYLFTWCSSSYQSSSVLHPFEFTLSEKPSSSTITKMSISHLLLDQHLLYTHTWVINYVDLSWDWATLIRAGQWSDTSCSIMDIIFILLSLSTSTLLSLLLLLFFIVVPHKACKRVSLHKLPTCWSIWDIVLGRPKSCLF